MNIVIVDDDQLICKSLELTLSKEEDITVLGTANDGQEAIALCEKTKPDIVLMDIRMPGVDGVQATRIIKKELPHIKIMMLTTFQDKQNIQLALQAGAEGYLLKTDKITNIGEKLRILFAGVAVLDGDVLKKLTTPDLPSIDKLTPREKDVLSLVSQGLTNKEISQQLFLSEGTIRNIVSIIMEKLEVKNRTQLSVLMNKN
ncbi:LuxR family two component transcriptional regulator [Natranaerovirga pectinivora]|uniref:Stage 0 sporulation protein A homolog n=1 Tax=Natranaerovirga pectinivora TaxID=682400 RepID=A0A4R3MNP5_9FIRM|nr:response regulator transcription factor [Natranaerovirga pectinivora]TCT16132.1 LuxR family two component transcriptional regulator [Natranaerovirga pectinivora]